MTSFFHQHLEKFVGEKRLLWNAPEDPTERPAMAVAETTSPEADEDAEIPAEELHFKPDQWKHVYGSVAKVRTSVQLAATDLTRGDEEVETGKVRDRGSITLLDPNPKAVALVDGKILIRNADGGIQQFSLTDDERWEVTAEDLDGEDVQTAFGSGETASAAAAADIAPLVAKSAGDIFTEQTTSSGYNAVNVPQTSLRLEPQSIGAAARPRTRIRIKNGSAMMLFDSHPEQLGPLKKTTVSSFHEGGTFVWCRFEFSKESRDVLFFADESGKMQRLSNDADRPFEQVAVGKSISCCALGNVLLIHKGDQVEVVNTPGLGDFQQQMTIGSTTYLAYNRQPQGQVVVAVDTETGKLNTEKGENGFITADAVAFDEEQQCLYTLTPTAKDRIKGVKTTDLRDLSKVATDLKMDEGDRSAVLKGIAAFREDLPGEDAEQSAETLLGHQTNLLHLADVLADRAAHAHIQPVYRQVRAALKSIDQVIEESRSVERRKRNAVKRLDEADHAFFEVVLTQKLPPVVRERLGSLVKRVGAYPSARTNYLTQRPPEAWVPADRWEESERSLAQEDACVEEYKTDILAKLREQIPKLTEQGAAYLTKLREAKDHTTLRAAQTEFEQSDWGGLYGLLNTIHKQARHFFSEDDESQAVKKMLDLALIPQSSGIGEQDVSKFNLADVDKYRARIFAKACSENIDPEAVESFQLEIRRIEGLVEQLDHAKSLAEIEERIIDIRTDVDRLEAGSYTKNWLNYDASCQRALDGLKHELLKREETARQALYTREHLEKQQLLQELDRQVEMIEGLMLHAARVEGHEAGHLTAEEQSRAAWNRVLAIVRGFDLTRKDRIEHEEGTHESMESLMILINKVEEEHKDKEKANKVWERLRQTLARCINRIEADKGYAANPGYYTFRLNKWYQDRLGAGNEIDDVLIPLAGKNPVQPLRIHTRINTEGRRPVLEMGLIGDDAFKRTLPLSQQYYDVLPGFYWEAPEDPALSRMYLGPKKLSREQVAAVKVIESLKDSKLTLRGIVKDLNDPEFDERRKLDELEYRIGPLLDELQEEQGFVFERAHRENTLRIVREIFKKALPSQLSADLEKPLIDKDFWKRADIQLEVSGLTSTHSSLQSGTLQTSLKDLKEAVETFEVLYGDELQKLHDYIRLNEGKVRRQMGLDQQEKQISLPYDYHPTGLDVVRMTHMANAHKQIQTSSDKGLVIVIGDVGEGKTVMARAYTILTNGRLHEINGQKLRHISSFDPFEQFSDAKNLKRALESTAAQQMFLFGSTLVVLGGTTAMIDEFPYLMAPALDSLLAALDIRREYPLNVHLDPFADLEGYEHTIDIFSPTGINDVSQDSVAICTGNKSIQNEDGEYIDVTVSEQVKSRSIVIDVDKIGEENEFLWKASLVERGASDLQLHPEDVQYIIARRLKHGRFQKPGKVDHQELKTTFQSDEDPRLRRIIDAIDMRCMAAEIIVEIQKATRQTRQYKGDLTQLGVPPVWMTAAGGRDVKELFAKLYNLSGEREARQIIYRYMKSHLNDRGEEHTETNRIWLANICKIWEDYPAGKGESIWKEHVALARRRKAVGDSEDAYQGILNGIFTTLDNASSHLKEALGSPTVGEDGEEGLGLLQTFVQLQSTAAEMAEGLSKQAPQKEVLAALQQLQASTNETMGSFTKALLADRQDRQSMLKALMAGIERLAEFNQNMYGGANGDTTADDQSPEPPAASSSVPTMDFG